MGMLNQLFAILLVGFLIWMLYRGIKNNPEAFAKANISKSFFTMGLLTLLLLGVVYFAIQSLK